MDLFSSVSVTPRVVVGLFPPVIAGEWSQLEEPDEEDAKVADQADNGAPSLASAIPDGLRRSLDSPRQSKDGESDTNSMLLKHTELVSAGPLGSILKVQLTNCRGKGIDASELGTNTIFSRHAFQIITMAPR